MGETAIHFLHFLYRCGYSAVCILAKQDSNSILLAALDQLTDVAANWEEELLYTERRIFNWVVIRFPYK